VPKISSPSRWRNRRALKTIDFTAFSANRSFGIAKAKEKSLEPKYQPNNKQNK
jgi:hypothetical protein